MKTITLSDEDWGNVSWLAGCGEDDKTYHIQNFPEDYGNDQDVAEAEKTLDDALSSFRRFQQALKEAK